MAIIRGKFFTLTPTSKVDIISNPGKRLTFIGAYSPPTIIGGDETTITENNVTYKVHTFTATGILTVTSANNNVASVEYLVLAAGGGGGGLVFGPNFSYPNSGSGGGAGGFRIGNVNLNSGTYTIIVGAGGAAGTQPAGTGGKGQDSFIGGSPTGPYIINSTGGGGGGGSNSGAGGGSGGGGGVFSTAGTGISGQGFPGGSGGPSAGGGGGGAGGAGNPGPAGGGGGLGVYSTFTGGSVYYAYGGTNGGVGSGPSNSGSGGGRASSGGSGIVIIRYRIS
jgi:hypothetical protein